MTKREKGEGYAIMIGDTWQEQFWREERRRHLRLNSFYASSDYAAAAPVEGWVSVNSSSSGGKAQPRKQSDWEEEARRIRKRESERIEHHHHGELCPDQHPGAVVDERLKLKLFKPLQQLGRDTGVEQQSHLQPGPIELQPSGLPKLLLLLLHCGLQPLLQPMLQLLQDDRAVSVDEEEENVLMEQCLELNGKAEVTSILKNSFKNCCRYLSICYFSMNIYNAYTSSKSFWIFFLSGNKVQNTQICLPILERAIWQILGLYCQRSANGGTTSWR